VRLANRPRDPGIRLVSSCSPEVIQQTRRLPARDHRVSRQRLIRQIKPMRLVASPIIPLHRDRGLIEIKPFSGCQGPADCEEKKGGLISTAAQSWHDLVAAEDTSSCKNRHHFLHANPHLRSSDSKPRKLNLGEESRFSRPCNWLGSLLHLAGPSVHIPTFLRRRCEAPRSPPRHSIMCQSTAKPTRF